MLNIIHGRLELKKYYRNIMTNKKLFVLVPSLKSAGPIKGAVALCNGIVNLIPATIVPLKKGVEDGLQLDKNVKIVSLANYKNWREKCKVYRQLLHQHGGANNVYSLSYCFSADIFNSFMSSDAIIMSSIRGNLYRNYLFDYGLPALFFRFFSLYDSA